MRPSGQLLRRGEPTFDERRAIDTLRRRRDFLVDELRGADYSGADYDRHEASALSWALAIVAEVRQKGGVNGRSR